VEGTTTVVYAVADDGLWRCPDSGGTFACTNLNQAPFADTATTIWAAIDGYRQGTETILFIGCALLLQPPTGLYDALWKVSVVNGVATFTDVITSSSVKNTLNGSAGSPWWLIHPDYANQTSYQLGQNGYDAAQIAVDPTNTQRVLVAGRSGVWRSDDGGGTWYPAVEGLATTIDRQVAIDPDSTSQLAVPDVDWVVLHSSSRFLDIPRRKPPVETSAYALAFHASTLYVGVGKRDDPLTGGGVWSNSSPYDDGAWTDESGGSPSLPGNRIFGVAAGTNATGSRVLLAVAANTSAPSDGLYRKVGTGGWQALDLSAPVGLSVKNEHVDFFWPRNSDGTASNRIFFYDPPTGLWRSTDYGATFSQAWNVTANDHRHTGTLAGFRSGTTDTLYVSEEDTAYKLTNVLQTPVTATPLTFNHTSPPPTILRPGPLSVDSQGRLFASHLAGGGGGARLYRAPTVDSLTVNEQVAPGYASQGLFPFGLTVGPDDYLYPALDGNSVGVGVPLRYR
jgi:hypothetical protein